MSIDHYHYNDRCSECSLLTIIVCLLFNDSIPHRGIGSIIISSAGEVTLCCAFIWIFVWIIRHKRESKISKVAQLFYNSKERSPYVHTDLSPLIHINHDNFNQHRMSNATEMACYEHSSLQWNGDNCFPSLHPWKASCMLRNLREKFISFLLLNKFTAGINLASIYLLTSSACSCFIWDFWFH